MQVSKTITGSLTVLLTVAILISGCKKKEEVEQREIMRPVKIMTVQASSNALRHSFPGKVRAAKRSELSFKVSGPLVALPIEEGQNVKKGDIIAQIQKRDFQTALDETKARKLNAEKQFRRYKELYSKKQVSKADFDSYRAARDIARAQLADAVNRLQDTSLQAPFDGVISKRFVENFQKVQAKEPIANLQDITRIEVLINIPELLMAFLKAGGKPDVRASFESIPGEEFALRVKEYSTQADPVTQTYQVVLEMDQPKAATILPGMTAMVKAMADQGSGTVTQAISIPAIAVLDAPGNKPFVWLLDNEQNTAHKAPVSIGHMKGSKNILIKEGLKNGDVVITAGITQLEEGMKVHPWDNQREGK